MSNSLSSLIFAGINTAHALLHGPSNTPQEMHEAQKIRFETFANLMSSLSYKSHQIRARQQYWCTQTLFIAQLIKAHTQTIEEITNTKICVDNEEGLLHAINALIIALDNKDNLNKFLCLLENDYHIIERTPIEEGAFYPVPCSEIQFVNGDVIELIKSLSNQKTRVVVDNASNSHRDGAAKYSAGSLEELLSRYTDSALKMALHFDDVHQRNKEKGHYAFAEKPKPINVGDYQKRYLQMVLTIVSKLIQKKEVYLNSDEFYKDLFHSFPNPKEKSAKLPIFFDLQNNAYEVPVNGGFTSAHWFADTKNLSTVAGVFEQLKAKNRPTPISVVSYAAPDLRHIETSPLDARATSNKILQHPAKEGNLGCMLSAGIELQCQQAIALANKYKEQGINQPIAVVFIMPGCGAFKNPEKSTSAHFISTIKYFYPLLEAHNITCYVAEYDPELHRLLKQTNETYGPELGELNILINSLAKHPSIHKKAIGVREQILRLIESEGPSVALSTHLSLTLQLLKAEPGEMRAKIAKKYKNNALSMQENFNPLWKALGVAMFVLGTAMTVAGVALIATGGGMLPGIGIASGGTLLAATGLGFFTHNKYRKLSDITQDLIEDNTMPPLRSL